MPKATPSMCVLVVKNDKDGKPLRAKSRIVVLGSFEDCLYKKSKRYDPVQKYSPLCLLTSKAVGDKLTPQQGDCKNVLCKTTLTDDEVAVIRPSIDDPVFQDNEYWLLNKTLYGLR